MVSHTVSSPACIHSEMQTQTLACPGDCTVCRHLVNYQEDLQGCDNSGDTSIELNVLQDHQELLEVKALQLTAGHTCPSIACFSQEE